MTINPGSEIVKTISDEMKADGLVPDAREAVLLEHVASVTDTINNLQAAVDRDGYTVTTDKGTIVHPAVVEMRQQRSLLRSYLMQIDMSDTHGGEASPVVDRNKSKAGKASARARGFGDPEKVNVWRAAR